MAPGRAAAATWAPGQWDVEGEVLVMRVAKVVGPQVHDPGDRRPSSRSQRHGSPEAAVAAFAKYVDDLVELARSREPTTEAWQSDVDEYGAAPDEEPPHEFV